LKCGHLDCHACEIGARTKGTGTISTNATISVVAVEEGRHVHDQIIQSALESVVFLGNSLHDMYAKCGSIEDARKVFHKMQSQDVVTWTAILGGFAIHGHGKEALKHFEQMCS